MSHDRWEYGIAHRSQDLTGDVHRSGMTETEAETWLDEWFADNGQPDAFRVIKRPLGPWEDSL